jgi:hypothetical protein
LKEQVDERGDEAGADAGEGEIELDAFRRRDGDAVLVLHGGRT